MGRLAVETTVSSRNQTGETRGRGSRAPASAETLGVNGEKSEADWRVGVREADCWKSSAHTFIHSFKDHCRSYSV